MPEQPILPGAPARHPPSVAPGGGLIVDDERQDARGTRTQPTAIPRGRQTTAAKRLPTAQSVAKPGPSEPVARPRVNVAGHFTIGSTKDEVLAVQGTPSQPGSSEWRYGASTVKFENDRVASWTEYAGFPLRARLVPAPGTQVAAGYFTIGSTRDEVLAVQGSPSQPGRFEWRYGASSVKFEDDRVASWTEYAGFPLKAKLVPAPGTQVAGGHFTIGSTKDEVLAVQGSPSQPGRSEWRYGASSVKFENDRVASWTEYAGFPLKAKPQPAHE